MDLLGRTGITGADVGTVVPETYYNHHKGETYELCTQIIRGNAHLVATITLKRVSAAFISGELGGRAQSFNYFLN